VGFAKRDLKMFKNRQGRNKLFHIKRALWSIDRILEENYSNEFKNDKAYYSELMDLKNSIEDLRSVAPNFEKEIESKRQNINDLFESGKIRKGMYSDKLIELDKALIRFQNSDIYLQKRLKTRIIFDQQYSSLFEDVIY
jgi:hypothetical protein